MTQFEATRAMLQQKLDTLTARLARIQGHLREPSNRDWKERATETENDEVLEQLDETQRREVQEIRTALARIDAGSYGACARCGEPIGEARLEALPYATLCIDCAP